MRAEYADGALRNVTWCGRGLEGLQLMRLSLGRRGDIMAPVKISLVTVGYMPPDFTRDRLRSWRSSLFEVVGKVEGYALSRDSDGPEWEYSDQAMERVLPTGRGSRRIPW